MRAETTGRFLTNSPPSSPPPLPPPFPSSIHIFTSSSSYFSHSGPHLPPLLLVPLLHSPPSFFPPPSASSLFDLLSSFSSSSILFLTFSSSSSSFFLLPRYLPPPPPPPLCPHQSASLHSGSDGEVENLCNFRAGVCLHERRIMEKGHSLVISSPTTPIHFHKMARRRKKKSGGKCQLVLKAERGERPATHNPQNTSIHSDLHTVNQQL